MKEIIKKCVNARIGQHPFSITEQENEEFLDGMCQCPDRAASLFYKPGLQQ